MLALPENLGHGVMMVDDDGGGKQTLPGAGRKTRAVDCTCLLLAGKSFLAPARASFLVYL